MSDLAEPRIDVEVLRQRVRYERLAGLLASSRVTVFPALGLGVAVLFVFWSFVNTAVLIGWFGALALIYGFRLVAAESFASSATPDVDRYERWMMVGAAANGLAWGLIGLIPLPSHSSEYEAFLGFLVSGVVASAIPSLGMHRRIAFAFVVPCVVPLGMRLLSHSDAVSLAMGTMVMLYLLVLYMTVQRNSARIEVSMQDRIEAEMHRAALAASRSELQQQRTVMNVIAHTQADYIAGQDERILFGDLLGDVLGLMNAPVGMIVASNDDDSTLHGHVLARQPVPAVGRVTLPRALFDAIHHEVGCGASALSAGLVNALCAAERWPIEEIVTITAVPLQAGDAFAGFVLIGEGPLTPPLDAALMQPVATTAAQLLMAVRAEHRRREAERRLDRARAQLETCITDTPASVAMLDRDLRVIAHSQQFVRDFGVDAQVLMGRALYDAVPEIPHRWRDAFARVLDGEVESVDEDPFIRSGGMVRWLRWQARPWYEPGGIVGGVVLFTEDVTQQKKSTDALNARERLLEQLTERVPGVLFQMRVRANGERSLLYVSSGSLRVLRLTRDQLIEDSARLFGACIAEDRRSLEDAFDRGSRSGTVRRDFRVQHVNGEMCWLRVQADATRLADGSAVWHGYIEDVSNQHRMTGPALGLSNEIDLVISATATR